MFRKLWSMKERIALILLLSLIFMGCQERVAPTKEDKKIMENLGDFPKEKLLKWMPYDNLINLIFSKTDTVLYFQKGSDIVFEVVPYQPTIKYSHFCNCDGSPQSERAYYTAEYHVLSADKTDIGDYMSYGWDCSRNEYKIVFHVEFPSTKGYGTSGYREYDFSSQVTPYDYNAIFDLIPDTVVVEDREWTSTIIANIGLVKVENRWTNEVWNLAE